jgi:hypothetical protein
MRSRSSAAAAAWNAERPPVVREHRSRPPELAPVTGHERSRPAHALTTGHRLGAPEGRGRRARPLPLLVRALLEAPRHQLIPARGDATHRGEGEPALDPVVGRLEDARDPLGREGALGTKVAQGHEDLLRPGLAEADKRLSQVARLSSLDDAVCGIALEGGIGGVAVLGHPQRPREAVASQAPAHLEVAADHPVQGPPEMDVRDVEGARRAGNGEDALEPGRVLRAHDPAEHLQAVAAGELHDLVDAAPVRGRRAPAAVGLERVVQLHIHAYELGAQSGGLREQPLFISNGVQQAWTIACDETGAA